MVEILMISAKLVTKDLYFRSKSYDAKNFCPNFRHQQNVIIRLKLHCTYGNVTKIW